MKRTNLSNRERSLCLSAIIVIYGVIGLVLFVSRGAPAKALRNPSAAGMQLVAVALAAGRPPPPVVPSRRARDFMPVRPVVFDFLSDQTDALTAAAMGCDVPQTIANAIGSDPVATLALAGAPDDLHTAAGAIAIWNQDWNPATAGPDGLLRPLRIEVLAAMSILDDACLAQEVRGPRFIEIAAGGRNFVLVFGSDVWTWKALQEVSTEVFSNTAVEPFEGRLTAVDPPSP